MTTRDQRIRMLVRGWFVVLAGLLAVGCASARMDREVTLNVVQVSAGEHDAAVTLLLHNGSATAFHYEADVRPNRPIIMVSSRGAFGWRNGPWTGCDSGMETFALAPGAELLIEHRVSFDSLRRGVRLGVFRAPSERRDVWSPRLPLPR